MGNGEMEKWTEEFEDRPGAASVLLINKHNNRKLDISCEATCLVGVFPETCNGCRGIWRSCQKARSYKVAAVASPFPRPLSQLYSPPVYSLVRCCVP